MVPALHADGAVLRRGGGVPVVPDPDVVRAAGLPRTTGAPVIGWEDVALMHEWRWQGTRLADGRPVSDRRDIQFGAVDQHRMLELIWVDPPWT